jgi:hypothetical protein
VEQSTALQQRPISMTMESRPTDDIERQVTAALLVYSKRTELFGSDVTSDPAWILLLELFAAKLWRRRLKLSDFKPIMRESTLARWVVVLEQRGLISCRLGRLASENVWVELTPEGAARMSALFECSDRVHSHAIARLRGLRE